KKYGLFCPSDADIIANVTKALLKQNGVAQSQSCKDPCTCGNQTVLPAAAGAPGFTFPMTGVQVSLTCQADLTITVTYNSATLSNGQPGGYAGYCSQPGG